MTEVELSPNLPPSQVRFLRYWALNMTMVRGWGWSWTPGFRYAEAEWQRFETLAASVTRAASAIWMTACPVIFILLAALAVGGLMIPLASALWPDPSKTPAIAFVALLALTSFLTIGFGFPLSMVWGGMIADRIGGDGTQPAAPGDPALHARIRQQLWRLIAAMCILFIPGTMLFIIFNIQAGPILTVLRAVTGVCVVIGMFSFQRSRR